MLYTGNNAYKELSGKTKAEKKSIERLYGARYSVSFELPYYDCIRSVTIDVMHNLFLGTAKHALSVWKDKKLLKSIRVHLAGRKSAVM